MQAAVLSCPPPFILKKIKQTLFLPQDCNSPLTYFPFFSNKKNDLDRTSQIGVQFCRILWCLCKTLSVPNPILLPSQSPLFLLALRYSLVTMACLLHSLADIAEKRHLRASPWLHIDTPGVSSHSLSHSHITFLDKPSIGKSWLIS